MGHYLVQAAYNAEAWSTLVGNPQDRSEPVREMVEDAGGSLTKAEAIAYQPPTPDIALQTPMRAG